MHHSNTVPSLARLWLFTMLIFTLSQAATKPPSPLITQYLQHMSAPEDINAIFLRERNPNNRAEIVQNCDMIAQRFANKLNGNALPDWTSSLLGNALQDKHIYVFESAVRQIGKLKAVQFEGSLIDLFGKLYPRFEGSPVPMQREIIAALGQTGGQASVEFLSSIIEKNIISDASDAALGAIEASCDSRFSGVLHRYIAYLDSRISEAKIANEKHVDTAKTKEAQERKMKESWSMNILRNTHDRAVRADDAIKKGRSHE